MRGRKDIDTRNRGGQKAKTVDGRRHRPTTASGSSTCARSRTPSTAYVTLRTAVLKARFDHNVAMAALSQGDGHARRRQRPLLPGPPDARTQSRTMNGHDRSPAAVSLSSSAPSCWPRRPTPGRAPRRRRSSERPSTTPSPSSRTSRSPGREKRAQRLAALRAVADRAFDWGEMARSSLGAQWRSLDAPAAQPLRGGLQGGPRRPLHGRHRPLPGDGDRDRRRLVAAKVRDGGANDADHRQPRARPDRLPHAGEQRLRGWSSTSTSRG